MILLGPENLKPKHQVVELTELKEMDGEFLVSYHIHHPFTGNHHYLEVTVPKDVDPIHPVWDEVTKEFQKLFTRTENMLVYRDILRTLIIEEIFKRTKKPPAKVARAEEKGKEVAPVPSEERARRYEALKELLSKISEMERIVGDESQPESERKKAEIRLKAFRTKAEAEARELGVDLSQPLPEKLPPSAVPKEDVQKAFDTLKELLSKINSMEAILSDQSQPESEKKKAEIRIKAFRTKAEAMAKELGVDLSQPLPESIPTAEAEVPDSAREEKSKLIKNLLQKAKEMDELSADETQPESEREKAKIRARAFRAKAENLAKEIGIDLNSLS